MDNTTDTPPATLPGLTPKVTVEHDTETGGVSLICPHCGERDRFREEDVLARSHPLDKVEVVDGVITLRWGQPEDKGQEHEAYACTACDQAVGLPYDLDQHWD